ncbi:MAG: enoyl-CoA hydratase-related protein [Robiginitomaculum sp.]|nr:enoyl-CoA hydratase-related protein [Robiginitomaculum sp.]
MTLPETKNLIAELEAGWLTISLNTPENRNALSADMSADLTAMLMAVRDNRSVRGITLRGNGGVFCAGGDLKGFTGGDADILAMSKGGAALFALVASMPQVVVVLVEGAAMAGGLGLACCADIVVTTQTAKYALTETRLGIVAAQIAPYVVARTGLVMAKHLMLTGALFDGEEAVKYGIADFVTDDLAAKETEIKKQVLQCAPVANALTKDLLAKLGADDFTDVAAQIFLTALQSDEGREGLTAFMQKRKPNWAGKT